MRGRERRPYFGPCEGPKEPLSLRVLSAGVRGACFSETSAKKFQNPKNPIYKFPRIYG